MPSYVEQAKALPQQALDMVAQLKPPPIKPSTQQPLSDLEYNACLRRIADFRRILDERAGLVPAEKADLLLPASNWDRTTRDYGYLDALMAGDRRRLNHLRFYTRFTGFSLYYMDYHRDRETPLDLPADLDAELAPRLATPDPWVQRFLVMTRSQPPEIVTAPPSRFAEIGWNVYGIPVNHDTCVYQERVGILHQAGIFVWLYRRINAGRKPLIVEIGSGFGGLAFRLKTLFPEVDYICLDLPESLLLANLYLGLALPGHAHTATFTPEPLKRDAVNGVRYVPNHLAFEALRGLGADLVINTLSFAEMTAEQVAAYGYMASAMLGPRGLLFEQNQDNRHVGMIECKSTLARVFPYRLDLPIIDPFGRSEGEATLWGNRPVSDVLKS
jgi:putative sugar O-methyltransferase